VAQKRVKRYPNVPQQYITSMGLLLKLCPPALCQTDTAVWCSTGSSFALSVSDYNVHAIQDGFFSDLDHLDLRSAKGHTTVEGRCGT
jgi:hypothetical protein